ncbi:hypothetical protein FRX31_027286 [Thalictrum thalictroides]|uniref:Uncharacterized protein n=1 Tax=Thalictrum thalictroides TaxID=46969 RepID=A0A7J6VED3_THATH|nr:hypothetical protein FRX31_027286 [Thalictrum thalictroides]
MNDWEDHSGKVLGQAVRLSNWRPKPAYSREQYLQLGKKLSLYPSLLLLLARVQLPIPLCYWR